MNAYFKDAAIGDAIHTEFVEHDELDLTDEELEKLKARACRAVSMDSGERVMPREYTEEFLQQPNRTSYADWLKGNG
jgi:peroxiredoxin